MDGRAPTEEPRSMKRRFTQLPIASIAVVVGSLLVGLSMGPVDAQSALTNGSVTVRSDGAVYLVMNSKRHWVATVQITDDELNAYPEAEPIYSGLAPFGSAGASASTGTTTSKTGSSTGTSTASKTGTSTSSKTGTTVATKTATKVASKTSSTSSADPEDEVAEGEVVVSPTSGADRKNPNDPTLAAVTTTVDPAAKAEPTGKTTCPD